MERLRILLFMPPKADGDAVNHELATRLENLLGEHADVDLRAAWADKDAVLKSYHLIHVLGCWSLAALRLHAKAHSLCIPTVYSPMGGLQPWVLKGHRSSYHYSLQRRAIRQASAIHLCSVLEQTTFDRLAWNPRTALIRNPVITNQLSFDDMGRQMLVLYRKVLDTHARLMLDDASRQAIGHLLQLGMDHDVLFEQDHCQALRDSLATLTPEHWRRILIYADDEQVTEILRKGLERIQFTAPPIVIAPEDRFPRQHKYAEGELNSRTLDYHHPSTLSRLDESLGKTETNERRLCLALLNLRHEAEGHSAPLRHLADIYAMLRFMDTDEDRLNEIAAELGLADFAARLMAVLRDLMRLSEGFMPFRPKDDGATQRLWQDFTKFNTWN